MPSIPPRLTELYFSDTSRDLLRARHRLVRRGPRRFTYTHRLDDPYGLLLAQVLPALTEAAHARLQINLAPAPDPAFRPDPERLEAWALRDCAGLARRHGLRFPAEARAPRDEALVHAAAHAAAFEGTALERLTQLVQLSETLFSGRAIPPHPGPSQPRPTRGPTHYQGAMLHYEGEWYWGLDRLCFLEQRLRGEGLSIPPTLDPAAPLAAHEGQLWGAPLGDPHAPLELFYSMRSPYAYLALERAVALAQRHDVTLELRVVLPMVARGLSVPRAKRMYIVRDVNRLAGQLGLRFGRIADPIAGIERAHAVAHYAAQNDRLLPWLRSVGSGAWAEGIDVNTDPGLRTLARRAGLDPAAAIASLGDESWRAPAEANRQALLDMGLWGVPSFRLGALTVWGQDRLDVVEAALRQRAPAP